MKALNKKNKILSSMAKSSSSRRELNNINNICAKASDRNDYYRSNISNSDYDSSLSSGSEWEKIIQPTELKEMNKLYQVVTNNIKNTYQRNDAI